MAKRKPVRRRRPTPGTAKRARGAAPARKTRAASARKRAGAQRASRAGGAKRAKAAPARRAAKPAPRARAKAVKPVASAKRTRAAKPVRAAVKRPKAAAAVKAKAAPAAPKRTAAPVRRLLPPDQGKRKRVLDLDRERRRVQEDDVVVSPTPPSSLGLDRTASAARSGRQELRERYDQHTETSPTLTGGDVDADWESAYSVGDEAPGGDNPTPDQNVVDDIGAAVGLEYDDNEELEGAERIEERDRHRWEYDPASSDDFDER